MSNKSLFIKTTAIILGVIIFLVIAVYALSGFFLEPYFRDKLINKLQKVNELEYKVKFESLDIQVFGGNVYMKGIELIPVNAPDLSGHGYKILLDKLDIEGLGVYDYVFNNKIDINKIKIENPTITLYQYMEATPDSARSTGMGNANDIKSINIDEFVLTNGRIKIFQVNDDHSNPLISANITIEGEKINYALDGKTIKQSLEYNMLESQISNLEMKPADSLRIIQIANIAVDGKSGTATFSEMGITTRFEKYELGNYLGHELDWMNISIEEIQLFRWNIEELLVNGNFRSSRINIQRPLITVFRDKRQPFPDKPDSKLPYAFLNELDMGIILDTLKIRNGDVTYQEHVENIEDYGEILFKNLNVDILTITNDSAVLAKNNHKGYMSATAKLMGVAPLEAEFVFDLTANETHKVNGKLAEIDLTKLNPMLSKVGYASIESGVAKSMDFNFSYDESSSSGEMKFLYENLEVDILSQDDGDKQDITTFLGDFIIDDENRNEDLKMGKIAFDRHKKKSLINYWWKSLLTGILSSVGADAKAEQVE